MEKGYLYSVYGNEKFAKEAIQSARSLISQDPKANISAITTNNLSRYFREEKFFDEVITPRIKFDKNFSNRKKAHIFKASTIYEHSPYKYSFFVDSDTYFVDNCRALFRLLEGHDVCMSKAPGAGKKMFEDYDIPSVYDMYNSGVILFRKNEEIKKLFKRWEVGYINESLLLDQKVMSMEIFNSDVSVFTLENNWNARFGKTDTYNGKVKILHGRHKSLERISRRINISTRKRIWISEMEFCLYPSLSLIYIIRVLLWTSLSVVEEGLRRIGLEESRYK